MLGIFYALLIGSSVALVDANGFTAFLHVTSRAVAEGILIYEKLSAADKKKWEEKALELNEEAKQRKNTTKAEVLERGAIFPNCGPYGSSGEVLPVSFSDISERLIC